MRVAVVVAMLAVAAGSPMTMAIAMTVARAVRVVLRPIPTVSATVWGVSTASVMLVAGLAMMDDVAIDRVANAPGEIAEPTECRAGREGLGHRCPELYLDTQSWMNERRCRIRC